MARFFWFTIEFDLMRSGDELRVYGSGLLSSYGEIEHAIAGRDVQGFPLQPEWVINQSFANRSLPAAVICCGFVRASVHAGGHAREMDAGGEAE
jgi:phenylalanine-4-hydroxylase